MNDLSHTLRRFNRFEIKYLVTLPGAETIQRDLGAFLTPDVHGNESGRYGISSLYYDSPDYRCYWEKIDGIKFRRKLRIRIYETEQQLTPDTPVFVEIKQRINRVTQKRRAALPYSQALHLCSSRQLPEHHPEDQAVIEEILAYLWQYNLQPSSLVRYERQALIGTDYDIGLRVTFDTRLTYQPGHLHLAERDYDLPLFAAHLAIMEIKVNERIPTWLTELVAAHNLNMVRISKYCRSIDLAHPFASQPRVFTLADTEI